MLTVKKFGATFNLSTGGYVAGLVGIIFALLTILVFPPDMDLQGRIFQWISWSLKLDLNFLLDDETESNVTTFLSTTISSIEDTTQDDDEHDDDESIPDHEKRDEINDSKEIAKN